MKMSKGNLISNGVSKHCWGWGKGGELSHILAACITSRGKEDR